jgi:hypothetical protein
LSSRGPTCCTTWPNLRTLELPRKLTRPGQTPDHRSQKRLDWHTCMPPVRRLHRQRSRCHDNLRVVNRQTRLAPSPPGLKAPQTVRPESFGSPTRARNPPPSLLRKLTERLQDAHGHLRAPTGTSGFHRTSPDVLNTSGCSPERLRAFTGGSSRAAAFRGHPHDLRSARTTSVAHQRRRLPPSLFGSSPEPPGSTGSLRRTHRSQRVHTRRPATIASFRYKGPIVRRHRPDRCTVSGATVVTFESTPRLSPLSQR